jgi:hypothetical protein
VARKSPAKKAADRSSYLNKSAIEMGSSRMGELKQRDEADMEGPGMRINAPRVKQQKAAVAASIARGRKKK